MTQMRHHKPSGVRGSASQYSVVARSAGGAWAGSHQRFVGHLAAPSDRARPAQRCSGELAACAEPLAETEGKDGRFQHVSVSGAVHAVLSASAIPQRRRTRPRATSADWCPQHSTEVPSPWLWLCCRGPSPRPSPKVLRAQVVCNHSLASPEGSLCLFYNMTDRSSSPPPLNIASNPPLMFVEI